MKALVITGILATTLLIPGCFHHRRPHGERYNTGRGYNGYQSEHGGYSGDGSIGSTVDDPHGRTVVDEYGNTIASDHILVDEHD